MEDGVGIMITKSDLGASSQGNCSRVNGDASVLNPCSKGLDSSSPFTEFESPPCGLKLNVRKQKVMLCNGHSDVAFQSNGDRGAKEGCTTMEVAATNGALSPVQAAVSKDSGFSTPAPSTGSSSRTATPCNSDHQDSMDTTDSTMAAVMNAHPAKSVVSSDVVKPSTASNIIENEVDDDNNDVFYFESDHTALKGNLDYQNLLKTVTLLESQRSRAINDLDKLIRTEREALNKPINFVQKLQRKVDVGIPPRLAVPTLPKLQWNKYTSNVDPLNLAKRKHMTRNKKLPKFPSNSKATSTAATPYSALDDQVASAEVDESPGSVEQPRIIRGRLKEEGKSKTFNELWTPEEQHRLEELLIKYPAEEVEARRWAKIAAELGNRTPNQVQSRTQKYFIKLAKAGLPIPGRMPNLQMYRGKGHGGHKSRRHRHAPPQTSTFMQSVVPPVFMSDAPEEYDFHEPPEGGTSNSASTDQQQQFNSASDTDSDDDIPVELKAGEEYEEMIRLKRLRREKMKEEGQARHIGFKCDRCDCDPIVGTRWHCVDCPRDISTDFCSNCFDSQFQTESHNSSHRLEQVSVQLQQQATSTVDSDYTRFTQHRDYNYLDPNYMPAS